MPNNRLNIVKWIASLFFTVFLPFPSAIGQSVGDQSGADLSPNHPQRYVVQEGDTLWRIARKFLKDPWLWTMTWQGNNKTANPRRIFPGDLLIVTHDHMIKAVRLQPEVHVQSLDRAIPTIPPSVIQPFLTSAIIVEPGELEGAGHVVSGVEGELILGKYMRFYARGLGASVKEYRLFRMGKGLHDPQTGELLGIESVHLGDALMHSEGTDVSTLTLFSANQEIGPGDRLLPGPRETSLPYYQPRSPDSQITGWILHAPGGMNKAGRFDVVIISGGEREGLKQGHVLKTLFQRGKRTDSLTNEEYSVNAEESGLMMVFRVFEKSSYALIMESTRAISVGDRYQSP